MNGPIEQYPELWQRWDAHLSEPSVGAALESVFAQVDQTIASHQARCGGCGRCCRFDAFDHALMCTGLEVTRALRFAGEAGLWPMDMSVRSIQTHPGCPFQDTSGGCQLRSGRPLGCRIFFCDPTMGHWQNDLYEQAISQIKALHDHDRIPYRFVEWRRALAGALAGGYGVGV